MEKIDQAVAEYEKDNEATASSIALKYHLKISDVTTALRLNGVQVRPTGGGYKYRCNLEAKCVEALRFWANNPTMPLTRMCINTGVNPLHFKEYCIKNGIRLQKHKVKSKLCPSVTHKTTLVI